MRLVKIHVTKKNTGIKPNSATPIRHDFQNTMPKTTTIEKEFWKILDLNREEFIRIGESEGIRNMLKKGIFFEGVKFTWFNTGNLDDLAKTEKALMNYNLLKSNKENNE